MQDKLDHEYWMRQAIIEAGKAAALNEIPIAAVLVKENQVIAKSVNLTINRCDPTAHAEIIVLREAAKALGNYRLLDTSLYVTIEPCLMCLGALIQARVKNIYFGAPNAKTGALTQHYDANALMGNHYFSEVKGGILLEDCTALMQQFFRNKRKN